MLQPSLFVCANATELAAAETAGASGPNRSATVQALLVQCCGAHALRLSYVQAPWLTLGPEQLAESDNAAFVQQQDKACPCPLPCELPVTAGMAVTPILVRL